MKDFFKLRSGRGLTAIAALVLLAAACGDHANAFDRRIWASGAGNYDGDNPRLDLVEPARNAGLQAGTERKELRRLLGEPDGTSPSADIWYIGRDDMSVDFKVLHIDYDAAGRSRSIEVTTQ